MNTKLRTEEKVFSFMEEHNMLTAGDKLVVGVSGGADSVCLLFVLLEYGKQIPFALEVVHVNHGIRTEAAQDAAYVEQLCKDNGIPFHLFEADVRRMAVQDKCSEEEAGRNVRYHAFEEVAKQVGANKIAVAHNANDRSETMLFHLFRGSGIKGLTSIRPLRDRIIRPILCLGRDEVEAYLEFRNIHYCRDATNDEDDYTRNRIRHHILPYAEREIVSGCVSHMAQTAELLGDIEDYLDQQTITAMEQCVRNEEIDVALFLEQHKVIRQRILYRAVTNLAQTAKDISHVHIASLLSLFTETGNRSVNLPYDIVGRRQYHKVILERQSENLQVANGQSGKTVCAQEEWKLQIPKDLHNPWIISLDEEWELELMLLEGDGILQDFPTSQYTKWFDYDKIKQSLTLRTRKVGDYFSIPGQDGVWRHKSVKDYMIDAKIPRQERDNIYLLAEGQHVLWLIGYRISEAYKINRNTKHILQVQLIRKG